MKGAPGEERGPAPMTPAPPHIPRNPPARTLYEVSCSPWRELITAEQRDTKGAIPALDSTPEISRPLAPVLHNGVRGKAERTAGVASERGHKEWP